MKAPVHTRTVMSGDAVVALERRPLRVTVTKGPDRKLRKEFASERIVIGTHDECDIVLSDATVSRQHCELALVREGYALRDLGSTNGTYIGDVRVRDVILEGGAVVRVAATTIKLAPLDEAVSVTLPSETRFGRMLGRSPEMRAVFAMLSKVAPSDSTVLVTGESGTGKELVARSIHEASSRASRPFIVVDCAGLPATLAESALYGHKKGSFTGAIRDQVGAFEAAEGGTVFLDEIGELPLALQARLLGVLQRREIQRVGETRPRAVDVRVIAATNRDLRVEINGGNFREDLYFRLAVVPIELPPLRQRPEDIALYARAILEELGGDPHGAFGEEELRALTSRSWPGNVRELRNLLERALAVGELEDEELSPGATVSGVNAALPFKVDKADVIEQFERAYVEQLLRRHDQNITHAARAAKIDRVYLLRLLDKFGLRPKKKKS